MFEAPAWLVAQFYALTHNYAIAIGLVALTVMVLVTPLTLKQTKGMLEMQRLQPEVKRLQAQYRGDRQKLSEETMKLYQEHKVNPLASCLPLLLQMPIFFIMYRVLHGLTNLTSKQVILSDGTVVPKGTFLPAYISQSSDLFKSLVGQTKMMSFGLDLSKSPAHFIGESFATGLPYAMLVVALGLLYFFQQRMVASRAQTSPTMSATQAKVMQYLPVVFAVFQLFFLTGLVIYYITQAIFRIGQNFYITKRFYGHEESLGRQAQKAGERAREEAKQLDKDGSAPAGGMFAQAKRDAQARRDAQATGKKPAGGSKPPARTGGKPSSNGKPNTSGRTSTKDASTKDGNTKDGNTRDTAIAPAKKAKAAPEPAAQAEPIVSKRVTPPKNRPTPSASGPQRPTASGRPGAPSRPKPPKK